MGPRDSAKFGGGADGVTGAGEVWWWVLADSPINESFSSFSIWGSSSSRVGKKFNSFSRSPTQGKNREKRNQNQNQNRRKQQEKKKKEKGLCFKTPIKGKGSNEIER